jgi:hypothetical protein
MDEEELKHKAAQIFINAAQYIRKSGWQVSGMGENGKPRCSMGALASANPDRKWDKNLAELMYESLYMELNGLSLTQFNYKYNNREKVARLYERTAHSLAKMHAPM